MKTHRFSEKKNDPTAENTASFPEETAAALGAAWNIDITSVHGEMAVQGSPERSLLRVVVEDAEGRLFLLEKLSPKTADRKRQIAAALHDLAENGLSRIAPYLRSTRGDFIVFYKNFFWRLSRFIKGVSLNREQYLFEPWRGRVLADFLLELRETSMRTPALSRQETFSLKRYVHQLAEQMALRDRNVFAETKPVLAFLENEFWAAHDDFPETFCHGDYHPLNIIWSDRGIQCVIDWEFSGPKKELYDIANLIGCAGMENPNALLGDLVSAFVRRLKASKTFSEKSWRYLPEFVLALRFAWLAEWLRQRDADMIALELDYLKLLAANKNLLQKTWL
jgi:homoserine kinase type II